MKSPEYVIHGTSSEEDAEKIQEQGFEAQEGRATVSGDLIYAFKWATEQERRKGSKSETEINEGEHGRMIIMAVPEDKSVDYGTNTGIEIDEVSKEVTGYSAKYESGRRQLAIYNEGDVVKKRKTIEKTKKELKEIDIVFSSFLRENDVDPDKIKSKEDLIEAIKDFNLEKQIIILKKAEELQSKRTEKRKEAESGVQIRQENVLMSLVPTSELGEKLDDLSEKIRNFQMIDLENFTEEIAKVIEGNKENFLATGLDIKRIIGDILATTVETEVVNMIRSLSMDVKRAQGYEIYNRGRDNIQEKKVDKKELKQKLEKIIAITEGDNFDMGIDKINRYIKMNAVKLLKELESV